MLSEIEVERKGRNAYRKSMVRYLKDLKFSDLADSYCNDAIIRIMLNNKLNKLRYNFTINVVSNY